MLIPAPFEFAIKIITRKSGYHWSNSIPDLLTIVHHEIYGSARLILVSDKVCSMIATNII